MSQKIEVQTPAVLRALLPTFDQLTEPQKKIWIELLSNLQGNQPIANQLLRLVEAFTVELGDVIDNYFPSHIGNPSVQSEQNHANLYIVAQGQVRLLSFSKELQREVSVQVLRESEMFGADHLFCQMPLAYRAIAASTAQIIQFPIANLQPWLGELPDLRERLQQQVSQRQCLIFLKAFSTGQTKNDNEPEAQTSFKHLRLNSYQIQELFPLLTEVQIPAGEPLAQAKLEQVSYYWLRQGTIQSAVGQSPLVGQGWKHPDATLPDWIAQTDLILYTLPTQQWEVATAIAPLLFGLPDPATNSTETDQDEQWSRIARGKRAAPLPSQQPLSLPPAQPTPRRESEVGNLSNAASSAWNGAAEENIAFPKPGKPYRFRRKAWHYPFIQQQSSSDCGVACLAMIGEYWGKRFSLNSLRQLAGVGRSGASLKNLAAAGDQVGFHARPVRASFSRLTDQPYPWIAHWQGDHYVVVYRIRRGRILIADPAIGKQSLSQAEFLENWTGYALLLDPSERLQETAEEKLSLGRFWNAFMPYRSVLGQIILASLLLQVFGLVTPLFTQIILDQVIVQKSSTTLHVFAIGLLIFGVWRTGLVAIRQYLLDFFTNRMDLSFVGGFVNHTLKLPLQFFEARQVGDIITRVQENQKIQVFLTRQAVSAWLDALTAVVYVGLMAYYNWQLTLLVLALLPPIVILTVVASPFLRQISRAIFKEAAGQNSSLMEMLSGVATIKAAAAERELRWLWEDRFTRLLNERFRGQKLANGLQVTSGVINTLGSTALLWYGAMLVIQGQLTIGQFVAFNMLIGRVIGPVLALVGLWDELQEVLVSVERLNDVFATPVEESAERQMLILPSLKGEIRFEDVTFRYQEGDANTLQNIEFEAHPGQTIAIVGRSGSGKSTLVKLLQGLYQPVSGRIWVDGHDIRHISVQSLRSQLGVVPQECFLFSGTILENITLFRSEFTLEDAIRVAKLAEAHSFIQDLPLGYNTKVGERGTNLSGGQRQRIAIARALLGDPRVLILDEATSSLDTESERRFQENLSRIARDRTVCIIAHRLSTVRHADHILVLDRGILTEQGTHDQLIAQGGIYYHLAQQQLNL
jgi:ATP-binding cassette subfamily B protein